MAAILLVGAGGAFGYAAVVASDDTILPNVYVMDQNLGGMTRQQATQKLQEAVTQTYGTLPLTVQLPDQTLEFDPQQVQASIDVEAAVEKAWEYGHTGNVFSRASLRKHAQESTHNIDVSDSLTLNTDYLSEVISQAAAEALTPRVDSVSTVDTAQGIVTIQVGTSGRSLDTEALLAAVETAYRQNDFNVLLFSYDVDHYHPVDLEALYQELCTDMADAYYDEANHVLVPEVNGFGFDLAAAKQQQDAAAEGAVFTLALGDIAPEKTLEDVKAELFPDVLSSYSSPHVVNANRTNNLDLSCKAINNTILNPGDVFSFNGIVGERTAEKGYKSAIVYVSGNSESQLGGGVCQVSSTIYMCTLLANLEQVERTEHMFAVTYVPMGMDATVYWGSLDYKFKNNLENPILVEANVADGYVNITLRGTKPQTDYDKIEMTYEILSTIPWSDVTKVDETKPADYSEVTQTPYTGYKAQTYRHFLDAEGNEIRSEKVAYSSYSKRDRVTTIGKQPEPETPPVDPTTPTDPATPTGPTQTPQDPGTTTEPTTPEQPQTPTEPATPTEPTAPQQSQEPAADNGFTTNS